MYELKKKKLERYWRVILLGPGPRLMKKEFTGLQSHKGWETLVYSMGTGISHKKKKKNPTCVFYTAVVLGIQGFFDVLLWRRVGVPQYAELTYCLHLQVLLGQRREF